MLTILGFIFLILGAIGIVLPMWPTTPFVLVSVACFTSSPKIKAQVLRVPIFRDHIENFERKTGLPQKTVQKSLIWLWGTLLISMAVVRKVWIIVLLSLIGVCVTLYLGSISKAKNDQREIID